MKKFSLKKLLSVIGGGVLLLSLILSFSVAALAADIDDGASTSSEATLNIPKSIIAYNPDGATVYAPDIQYTYSITAGDAITSKTFAVEGGSTASFGVKEGIPGAVSIDYSAVKWVQTETLSTTAAGTESDSKNIVVTVTVGTNFDATGAGIYHYVITDTTPSADLIAAGITRPDDYETTRDLFVIISNSDSGYVISGYILTEEGSTTTDKNGGYTKQYDIVDDTVGGGSDNYYTYNLTVNKTVSGSGADKTHAFPFTVTISNGIVDYNYDVTGATKDTANNYKVAGSLKGGDSIVITGLAVEPGKTLTAVITDENDTADTYTATLTSVTGEKTASSATLDDSELSPDETATLDAVNIDNTASKTEVTIDNALTTISPTGLILRFAPYAIMLGVGALLFGLSRTKRKDENAAV